MVFFVCEGCNESLKKNQVDNHAAKCRSCYAVTCVDCNVTFPDDEYREHTSCVSEKERYEKTIYRGVKKADLVSGKTNKKLSPQDTWNKLLQDASTSSSAPQEIKAHLNELAKLDNVPRKNKQFVNFTDNSLRLRGSGVVGKIWNFLEGMRNEKRESVAAAAVVVEEKSAVIEKKRKSESVDNEEGKSEKKAKKEKKNKKEKSNEDEKVEVEAKESEAVLPDPPKKEKKEKKVKEVVPAEVVAKEIVVEKSEKKAKKNKKNKEDKS